MEAFTVVVVSLLLILIFILVYSVMKFKQTSAIFLHNQSIINKNISILEKDLSKAALKVGDLDKKVEGYIHEMHELKEKIENINHKGNGTN